MSSSSREMVYKRRAGGIYDLSEVSLQNGDLTLEEAEENGLYKVNCKHQIGIATSSEQGLAQARYPIRILIGNNGREADQVDTCCSYWIVANAAADPIVFQRKPLSSTNCIAALYRNIPEFDELAWTYWKGARERNPVPGMTLAPPVTEISTRLYNTCLTPNMTAAQKASISTDFMALIAAATAANVVPYIQVTADAYIWLRPHGVAYAGAFGMTANQVAFRESVLTIAVNYRQLNERYPNVPVGTKTGCAYAIGAMFRYGLFESYEHREYHTVVVAPVANSATDFTVTSVNFAGGTTVPGYLAVGQVLSTAGIKMIKMLHEISLLLNWCSGLNHYLFNHTTGGTIVQGPLLTVMAMYKLAVQGMSDEALTDATSVVYESIHPTNKRSVANMFFDNSNVYTHGRLRSANMYEQFDMDSFAAIRGNPYPAGSHKAYTCLSGLKRVVNSGLSPFLPWSGAIPDCIALCRDVLKNGARAHMGSNYYTGESPMAQSSSIDAYLPEIARFMQTFHRGDSLTQSPHMSATVAARAEVNWTTLLNSLKSADVSATDPEVVKKYLSTQGSIAVSFNAGDETTWAQCAADSRVHIAAIEAVFT